MDQALLARGKKAGLIFWGGSNHVLISNDFFIILNLVSRNE